MTSHILRYLLPQLRQWPTPAGAHKNLTSPQIQIIHLLLYIDHAPAHERQSIVIECRYIITLDK